MKKLLLSIIVFGIIFSIPTKAQPYDVNNIVGGALVITGLATSYISNKLAIDAFEKEIKLTERLRNGILNVNRKEILQQFCRSTFAGITSFSATAVGLFLLSNSKATGVTLLAHGLAGLYYTKSRLNNTKKLNENLEETEKSLPEIPNRNKEKTIWTNSNKLVATLSLGSTVGGAVLLGYHYFPKLNGIQISNFYFHLPIFPTCFTLDQGN